MGFSLLEGWHHARTVGFPALTALSRSRLVGFQCRLVGFARRFVGFGVRSVGFRGLPAFAQGHMVGFCIQISYAPVVFPQQTHKITSFSH